ncbi:unnamed protein product [Phytophthora fragariaefolia]|uniref:Unnamed protein product n=1 Tax=Phytophthora fragariaefolia TaxID=1490495 RepID=A0A9W6YBT8_9STRA|nr:unnamed protein product [Phytophthora fragariaefolia]
MLEVAGRIERPISAYLQAKVGFAGILEVPPRYTYVCQPADISWNKPLKARLRAQWIECLRSQLVEYRAGEIRRKKQQVQLQHEIDRARKELVQKKADIEVERLRALLTEEPFVLTPPNRVDITEWISTSWGDLSIETIVSGFAKVGILTYTRVAEAMPTDDAAS